MWRHYVYLHRRADTNDVFYVGKGSERTRRKTLTYERAHCLSGRSKWWRRVVAKHGFVADVIASFEHDRDAQDFERQKIAMFDRRNLVNLTDGGDGHAGITYSAATRAKRSLSARGPRSEKWVQSIRRARANGGNGGVVKRGDILPASWRANISAAVSGEKNHMRGKPSTRRRAVVDTKTGATYPSVTHAAEAFGIRMQTLHNMLTSFRVNTTALRFA